MIDPLLTIYSYVSTLTIMMMTVDGQINRYINPVWLEMDANSEYYPGGEVISQILRAYGLGDASYDGLSRYRLPPSSVVIDRNGYGTRSYPRNRVAAINLNNAYDSDPLALEYLDRNYDYVDNTIRGSGNTRYRNGMIDVPRRNRIAALPGTVYHPSDYADRVLPLRPYARSRLPQQAADGDPAAVVSQELRYRNGETAARLVPRSTTVAYTNTDEKRQTSS